MNNGIKMKTEFITLERVQKRGRYLICFNSTISYCNVPERFNSLKHATSIEITWEKMTKGFGIEVDCECLYPKKNGNAMFKRFTSKLGNG